MATQRKEYIIGNEEVKKVSGNNRLKKAIAAKDEAAAHKKKKERSVKVARRDEAHKSNRGNGGGNLGKSR